MLGAAVLGYTDQGPGDLQTEPGNAEEGELSAGESCHFLGVSLELDSHMPGETYELVKMLPSEKRIDICYQEI